MYTITGNLWNSGQSREPSSSTDVLWHFGPGYLLWSTPLFPPALTRCAGDTGGGTMDLGLDPEPWVLFHCLCDHGELFLLSEPWCFKWLIFEMDHNLYQLHGVVVRIQCRSFIQEMLRIVKCCRDQGLSSIRCLWSPTFLFPESYPQYTLSVVIYS